MNSTFYKTLLSSAVRDISVIGGPVRTNKITLYTFQHNELFFLPIFLDYYRALGVEQFVILDDHSNDGSQDFLLNQGDVVLLKSKFNFGDVFPGGASNYVGRIGTLWKAAIPRYLLGLEYVLYVDVDEFLILPSGLQINDIFNFCRDKRILSVCASQVEMFPKLFNDKGTIYWPSSFQELLSENAYFDAAPLIDVTKNGVVRVGESTSRRLFRTHNIVSSSNKGVLADTSIYKTPIFWNSEDSFLISSHDANTPPSTEIVLGLLHFKFAQNAREKVSVAIGRKGHNQKGAKYNAYNELFKCLGDNIDLRSPVSAQFVDFNSLAMFGLARFP